MDLEMTGLDHTSDVIVEIATIITDDNLDVIAEGPDLVIGQPPDVLAAMEPIVLDMHTRSGLLDAVRTSEVTLDEAGQATLDFIRAHAPEPRTVPLCGNSIGTDRRFLAAYLPAIEEHLHYRSIDVSSIKELVRRWYPKIGQGRPQKQGQHRALDDIRESIDELRYYRERVFVRPATATRPPDRARRGARRVRRAGGPAASVRSSRRYPVPTTCSSTSITRPSTEPTSCSGAASTRTRAAASRAPRRRSRAWSTPASSPPSAIASPAGRSATR